MYIHTHIFTYYILKAWIYTYTYTLYIHAFVTIYIYTHIFKRYTAIVTSYPRKATLC